MTWPLESPEKLSARITEGQNSKIRIFTNDEILTSPTDSPLILLPAIPGKVFIPTLLILSFRWVADLTNVDNGNEVITLEYSSGFGSIGQASKNDIFTGGESRCSVVDMASLMDNYVPFNTDVITDGALQLVITNGEEGNFTGGDPANRLTAKLLYTTVDL